MKRQQSQSKTGFSPTEKKTQLGVETLAANMTDLQVTQMAEETNRLSMQHAGPSGASRTSRTSMRSNASVKPELDRTYTFAKDKQEGPWRDKLTVDIFKMGEEDFKGTIKLKEAKNDIYKKALGLKRENLHAIEMEYRGHPVVTFRLKQVLNIDVEFSTDTFSFMREGAEGPVMLHGRIRGVRTVTGGGTFIRGDNTRLKLKNCKWSLEENDINEWLNYYGTVTTPISEETYKESDGDTTGDDEDDEQDCPPLGTGNLWVTMKLGWKIPQFLPMMGRKIEVYHRGIVQTCVNCYQNGHKRQDCQNERLHWLDYVADFIESNELRPEMYGKWFPITAEIRRKHQQNAVVEEVTEQLPGEVDGGGEDQHKDETSTVMGVQTFVTHDKGKEKETRQHASTSPSRNQDESLAEYRKSASYRKNVGGTQDARIANREAPYNEVVRIGLTAGRGRPATATEVGKDDGKEESKKNRQATATEVGKDDGKEESKKNRQATATNQNSKAGWRGGGRGREHHY